MFMQQEVVINAVYSVMEVSNQAESIVGALVAVALAKTVLPASFAMVGGLAEAFRHIKGMFPGSDIPACMFILTTFITLPLYVALLGLMNQIIGGEILSISFVLVAVFLGLSLFTGWRLLSIRISLGEEEARKKVWWLGIYDLCLRIILGVGLIALFAVWVQDDDLGIERWIRENMDPRHDVLPWSLFISFVARKIQTGILSTDAFISAYTQAELHQYEDLHRGCQREQRERHYSTIDALNRLCAKNPRDAIASGPLKGHLP